MKTRPQAFRYAVQTPAVSISAISLGVAFGIGTLSADTVEVDQQVQGSGGNGNLSLMIADPLEVHAVSNAFVQGFHEDDGTDTGLAAAVSRLFGVRQSVLDIGGEGTSITINEFSVSVGALAESHLRSEGEADVRSFGALAEVEEVFGVAQLHAEVGEDSASALMNEGPVAVAADVLVTTQAIADGDALATITRADIREVYGILQYHDDAGGDVSAVIVNDGDLTLALDAAAELDVRALGDARVVDSDTDLTDPAVTVSEVYGLAQRISQVGGSVGAVAVQEEGQALTVDVGARFETDLDAGGNVGWDGSIGDITQTSRYPRSTVCGRRRSR